MIFAYIFIVTFFVLFGLIPFHLGMLLAYRETKSEKILRIVRKMGDIIYFLCFVIVVTPFFSVYSGDPISEVLDYFEFIDKLKGLGIYGIYIGFLWFFLEIRRIKSDVEDVDTHLNKRLDDFRISLDKRIDDVRDELHNLNENFRAMLKYK